MKKATMYMSPSCGYCQSAKSLLARNGVVQIEMIDISQSRSAMTEMVAMTGRRTVPQIYIGDTHVGGFDDLAALEKTGKLSALLAP